MVNTFKTMYEPIANAAAQKYGIPTDLFSRLIESESSWNPYAEGKPLTDGTTAKGIAQFLPTTAAEYGIDPFKPEESLNAAALYLSKNLEKYGDWGKAVAQYKGFSDLDVGAQSTVVRKVIGDLPDTAENEVLKGASGQGTPKKEVEKKNYQTTAIWRWTGEDWKEFFLTTSVGIGLLILGLVIIGLSLYALIVRGANKATSAVPELRNIGKA